MIPKVTYNSRCAPDPNDTVTWAIRRVDQDDLTEEQIEKIGTTLMVLEERMTELREHFGLSPEDLNIDLGPLGPLLPYQ